MLGRRIRSTGGSSDLLASLLKAPTKVASELTGGLPLSGVTTSSKPEKPAKAKKSGKKSGTKSGKSDAEKAAKAEKKAKKQQKEIQELRSQVSELTQAVTMLLQEKVEQETKKDG